MCPECRWAQARPEPLRAKTAPSTVLPQVPGALAARLAPEYLFCNRKRLPPGDEPLWPGPWQWVIYTLNEATDIKHYLARGAHMVETNKIRTLLSDPGLQG